MDFTRLAFLTLTLLALAFPVRRYVLWFHEHGFDLERLAAEVTVNAPATGLVGSMLIASAATIIFIIGEAFLRRDWLSLICVPVTLLCGVAVGLPFYLWMRLRPLHRLP
ncbi:MAG: DUF2834 domain-containing protein [Pseudomonadota bacterium]